jgi:hypothetical protein
LRAVANEAQQTIHLLLSDFGGMLSAVNRRTIASAGLLFALSCSTNIAKPGDPPAVAEVQLVGISPLPGSQLTAATVLAAEIKYTIKNYKPSVDYYVAPVFASAKATGVTSSMLDRISDSPKISSPDGTVKVRYPISRELASPELARPVKVWFYVMERIGAGNTRVIGKTEELQFGRAG